jgi:hypothetical protein
MARSAQMVLERSTLRRLSAAAMRAAMSGERLSVLIVAANASARWAGEAILPLHIFPGPLKAGHDASMRVGNEAKPELDELLGPDAQRISYEDAQMHSAFRWSQDRTSLWMGFHPLYYLQVLARQWRQRGSAAHLVDVLDADCEILIEPRDPARGFHECTELPSRS